MKKVLIGFIVILGLVLCLFYWFYTENRQENLSKAPKPFNVMPDPRVRDMFESDSIK